MIALCLKHHKFADAGGFTKQQLVEMKQSQPCVDSVREQFPWARSQLLIRAGGFWCSQIEALLKICGTPILSVDADKDGLLKLDLIAFDDLGNPALAIRRNELLAWNDSIYDLEIQASATRLIARAGRRKPIFEMTFKNLTLAQLDEVIAQDALSASASENSSVATQIRDYARSHCQDGMIALVDIRRFSGSFKQSSFDFRSDYVQIDGVQLRFGCQFGIACPIECFADHPCLPEKYRAERSSSNLHIRRRNRNS